MLLIPTYVAPSRRHGNGLFAAVALPRGTAIWRFQPGFDREFTPEQYAALPEPARKHIQYYAYFSHPPGLWVLNGDHAGFMNHSADPNTGAGGQAETPVITRALRDIAAGEELTCDYRAFDAEAAAKLGSALAKP